MPSPSELRGANSRAHAGVAPPPLFVILSIFLSVRSCSLRQTYIEIVGGLLTNPQEPSQAEVAGRCLPVDVAVVSDVEDQAPLNYDVAISQSIVDLMTVEVYVGGL